MVYSSNKKNNLGEAVTRLLIERGASILEQNDGDMDLDQEALLSFLTYMRQGEAMPAALQKPGKSIQNALQLAFHFR